MQHEGNGDTNCNWCNPQRIGKRNGRLGNESTRGDHPEYIILKIGQDT